MPLDPACPPEAIVGPYRLLRALGEGSTGTVYLAERTDFSQRVALKLFHHAFLIQAVSSPAGEEERILTLLDHPHIVRTLAQTAQPLAGPRFLVMEYIDGEPIDRFADAHTLALAPRVALLLQALDALEHAHRHLIVHRDLKPAHLLVTSERQCKLLDFGTAGALAPAAFTPDYASPEQRSPLARTAPFSVAADLYSFGLIARLVLAGVPPTADPSVEPSALVARLAPELRSQGAAARGFPGQHAGRRWVGSLRGDLDAILLRALQPAPEARYLSAAQFAGDLRAWAAGSPVLARPVGKAEHARRWMVQHRFLSTAAAVLLVAILLSSAGVVWQSAHAITERRNAEKRLQELVRLTGTLDGELYTSIGALPNSKQARTLLLHSVADTLDEVAATTAPDPALRLELAAQYHRLAALQLAPTAGKQEGNRPEAEQAVQKGLLLLQQIPASSRQGPAAQTERASLLTMQANLHAGT